MSSLMIATHDVSIDERPRLVLTLIGADRIAFMQKLLQRATNTHWEELTDNEKRFVDEACGTLNQQAGVEAVKIGNKGAYGGYSVYKGRTPLVGDTPRGCCESIAIVDESPFYRTTDAVTVLGVSIVKDDSVPIDTLRAIGEAPPHHPV